MPRATRSAVLLLLLALLAPPPAVAQAVGPVFRRVKDSVVTINEREAGREGETTFISKLKAQLP